MDEMVRRTTARRIRQLVRGAAEENVVAMYPETLSQPSRSKTSLLRVLVAALLLALLPMGGPTPTRSEPASVALYNPDGNCGISKYHMADCDPNEHIVEVLIGGRPHHTAGLGERKNFPVF